MDELFPIYKETGSGVMFVHALGAMRAGCVVCVGGDAEAGDGVWVEGVQVSRKNGGGVL